jgi:hypothetical protein
MLSITPIIAQPASSTASNVAAPIVGLAGVMAGVLITGYLTRRRERSQRLWDKRAESYLEIIKQVRTFYQLIDRNLPGRPTHEEIADARSQRRDVTAPLAVIASGPVYANTSALMTAIDEWYEYADAHPAERLERWTVTPTGEMSRLLRNAMSIYPMLIRQIHRDLGVKQLHAAPRTWKEVRQLRFYRRPVIPMALHEAILMHGDMYPNTKATDKDS